MKRPQEVAQEQQAMGSIVQLTSALEGLASMRIAQIKNQVLSSQQFFNELWNIYSQIRVDTKFHFGRSQFDLEVSDKELLIILTAEGGFSGDIDQKLIQLMLSDYHPDKQDIIVVGYHGAVQLAQRGIGFKRYYKMPEKDQNINTAPLIKHIQGYSDTTVYYQTYISLMIQDVKRIRLSKAVQEKGGDVAAGKDVISEQTYIFEPSTFDVIDHLESSMLQIALSQLLLESKLAQYASRFRAMTVSNNKANESYNDLRLLYHRAKRSQSDERLRELVSNRRILEAQS